VKKENARSIIQNPAATCETTAEVTREVMRFKERQHGILTCILAAFLAFRDLFGRME